MKERDIDRFVDSFIDEERDLPVNPFLTTRILDRINDSSPHSARQIPLWQGVAMGLSFTLVTVLGIKAGSMYYRANTDSNATKVMIMSDDAMEHFAFYQQTPKE